MVRCDEDSESSRLPGRPAPLTAGHEAIAFRGGDGKWRTWGRDEAQERWRIWAAGKTGGTV
jgi:hypothetical protein